MRYSHFFGKSKKEINQKFDSISHRLLIKAGYIDQVASGIYNLLPLGKIVLQKIEEIIREEMNNIGAFEIQMPILHPKIFWEKTKRWNSVDVLFRTKSRFGQEYGLAPTHEETVVPLVKKWVNSYRDLPLAVYHITQKFRDEPRPKSGILRGREFGMKDLYSFHTDKDDFEKYYQKVIEAYLKIFKRCDLKEIKITEASGGTFTKKHSHEFNVLTPAGEVDLIYCAHCSFAQNIEIITDKKLTCPKCQGKNLQQGKAIEVGNIFDLGTRFSEAFDLKYSDKNGVKHFCHMGCYGIGTSRLIGAVVEINHDEKGIIWPKEISPFRAYLIGLDQKDNEVKDFTEEVYQSLKEQGISVLFDDRDEVSAGEKFANADLLGFPFRLVISKKTNRKIEIKARGKNEIMLIEKEEIIKKLKI